MNSVNIADDRICPLIYHPPNGRRAVHPMREIRCPCNGTQLLKNLAMLLIVVQQLSRTMHSSFAF